MTDQITYASVCSGIEAASAAWHPLQWKPLILSEIEAFPRAVLLHHYPDVKLVGDFTDLIDDPPDVDVLVGGTPCQEFSMAGLRAGLEGARGDLTLQFIRLINAIDNLRRDRGKHPCVFVWENVPGVFTIKNNGFGQIIAAMVGEDTPIVPAGGRWTDAGLVIGPRRAAAWRTLDSQFFGLAQRRKRVFIVGSAAEGFDPSAVLLESEGVRRHSPPRRESGQRTSAPAEVRAGSGREPGAEDSLIADVAPTIPSREHGGGGMGTDFDLDGGLIANALMAADSRRVARRDGDNLIAAVAPPLNARDRGQPGTVPDDAEGLIPVLEREVVAPLDASFGKGWGQDNQSANMRCPHLIAMSSGQANAEITTNGGAPTLTCLHETPIIAGAFNNTGQGWWNESDTASPVRDMSAGSGSKEATVIAIAFKPSHFTRGKDGAPGDVVPPLSADADKGDQDTVVFSLMPMNSGKDFKARPTDIAQPLMGAGPVKGNQGGDYIVHPPVEAFNARQDPITYGDRSGPLDTDGNTIAIAFSAKDHGQDAQEGLAPTMRAMHEVDGHANGGGQIAIAFDTTQLTSKISRSNPKDGDPCHTLAAGANPPALTNGWEVRRLTPIECERLQGFPLSRTVVEFSICLDHQRSVVDVAVSCRKSLNNALRAGEDWSLPNVDPAASNSDISPADRAPLVGLYVATDCGAPLRAIRSAGRSMWSASLAEQSNAFRLPMAAADIADALVRIGHGAARVVLNGRAESRLHIRNSSAADAGNLSASESGGGTMGIAADVASAAKKGTFTTSDLGRATPDIGSALETWCCSTLRVIAGFIPEITLPVNSSIVIELLEGYTDVPYRKKPAADGPRYKTLGNSMSVPVMEWIGGRLQTALAWLKANPPQKPKKGKKT